MGLPPVIEGLCRLMAAPILVVLPSPVVQPPCLVAVVLVFWRSMK